MPDRRIELFKTLEIETNSSCNRRCPGCIRNSIPDKSATRSWFEDHQLSLVDFNRVLDESCALGFQGPVCLSHYNEPLMDPRIADLARIVKKRGFARVFMGSNADLLTEELTKNLDGSLDEIGFALYMDEPQLSKRSAWIKGLFKKTYVTIAHGDHMITHYSPLADHVALAAAHCNNVCRHPLKRMIVNHKGDMLMCCDDLTGHFDLGNIRDHTIEELWYGDEHQRMVLALCQPGGRSVHPHCVSCPRQ